MRHFRESLYGYRRSGRTFSNILGPSPNFQENGVWPPSPDLPAMKPRYSRVPAATGHHERRLDSGRDHPRFEHGLHRRHGGERGAAGAAIGPGCDARRGSVGGGILCALPGGAAAHWRIFGRPLRPPQDLRHRRRALLGGLGMVRTGARHPAVDCRARCSRASAERCWSPEAWRSSARIFLKQERGRAIGTWSGFTSITAAIGPVLGGWFTEHGSWRWVFFINLPIGLCVLLLAIWKVPESRAGQQERAVRLAGRRVGRARASAASSMG